MILGRRLVSERAVAVEVGEVDRLLEARRLGVDERARPAASALLEEPEPRRERARDEVHLAVAIHVARLDGAHLPVGGTVATTALVKAPFAKRYSLTVTGRMICPRRADRTFHTT